jgi:hypothetical protein
MEKTTTYCGVNTDFDLLGKVLQARSNYTSAELIKKALTNHKNVKIQTTCTP